MLKHTLVPGGHLYGVLFLAAAKHLAAIIFLPRGAFSPPPPPKKKEG